MTGNLLMVELPSELAAQLAAMPEAARSNFTVAALAYALRDADLLESMTEDSNGIEEIREALDEFEAGDARGETGVSLDEAWAELDRRTSARRRSREQ